MNRVWAGVCCNFEIECEEKCTFYFTYFLCYVLIVSVCLILVG